MLVPLLVPLVLIPAAAVHFARSGIDEREHDELKREHDDLKREHAEGEREQAEDERESDADGRTNDDPTLT